MPTTTRGAAEMTQMVREELGEPEQSPADVTERLFTHFGSRFPLTVIIDVVREARADLAGTPASALPELLERLATYRLRALSGEAEPGDEDRGRPT
jgi:hypothetical protein